MNSTKTSVRLGLVILLGITAFGVGCGGYNNSSGTGGVTPNTKGDNHLYVVNSVDATVSGFSIDPTNGSLTSIGPAIRTGAFPEVPAATPDGRFLYVANTSRASNSVSGFVIDPATGVLTPTTPAQFPITGDALPDGITVDPSSTHVYTANVSSVSAFTIDRGTGALTELRGSPVLMNATENIDLKISPDGKFLFVTDALSNSVSSFTFSDTGLPIKTGEPVAAGQFPTGIAVDGGSKFVYVANKNTDDISGYTITPQTGVLVPIGKVSAGQACGPQELAIDPESKFLFVSCTGDRADTIVRFNIDARTGALSPLQQVFPTGGNTTPRGVVVDPSGKFLFSVLGTTDQVSTQAIDAAGNLAPSGLPKGTGQSPLGVAISKTQ